MGKTPVLVIMAAGLGSRYGGLKQLDAMDEGGHRLIDYAVFDAKRAGFETVYFIIRKENQEDFHNPIGSRMEACLDVHYIYQELTHVPEECFVPAERTKPLGTGHAIWCCKDVVKCPFVVINADDYYGVSAYQQMYDYLTGLPSDSTAAYGMAGFQLDRTLSEHGTVARGICQTDGSGYLRSIDEQTSIAKKDGKIFAQARSDEAPRVLAPDTTVSMNMWGFTPDVFPFLEEGLCHFLNMTLPEDPLKAEYYLPKELDRLVEDGSVHVRVLPVTEQWYGVTYKEDKPLVTAALARMQKEGIYPKYLWEVMQ